MACSFPSQTFNQCHCGHSNGPTQWVPISYGFGSMPFGPFYQRSGYSCEAFGPLSTFDQENCCSSGNGFGIIQFGLRLGGNGDSVFDEINFGPIGFITTHFSPLGQSFGAFGSGPHPKKECPFGNKCGSKQFRSTYPTRGSEQNKQDSADRRSTFPGCGLLNCGSCAFNQASGSQVPKQSNHCNNNAGEFVSSSSNEIVGEKQFEKPDLTFDQHIPKDGPQPSVSNKPQYHPNGSNPNCHSFEKPSISHLFDPAFLRRSFDEIFQYNNEPSREELLSIIEALVFGSQQPSTSPDEETGKEDCKSTPTVEGDEDQEEKN